MVLKQRQQGMTLIGILLIAILVGFVALIGLRLIPIYLESFKVSSAISSLSREPGIGTKSPLEIKKLFGRRLDIDDVESVGSEDLVVERGPGVLYISIEYQIQRPVMGNLDVLATFSNEVEVPIR